MPNGENQYDEARENWRKLKADLIHQGLTRKWAEVLILIGLFHLVASTACHILYKYVTIAPLPYIVIWSTQLALNIYAIRRLIGRDWASSTPLSGFWPESGLPSL